MNRLLFCLVIAIGLLCAAPCRAEFIENNSGTVTDTETGLMWQQFAAGPMNWYSARQYCEVLILAGYNDWRLPTIDELKNLKTDIDNAPAAGDYFPGPADESFWSSSQVDLHPDEIQHLNFFSGDVYWDAPEATHYVRAVRNVE